MSDVWIEVRRPSSPIATYRTWQRSPIEPLTAEDAERNIKERKPPGSDWEYRTVPVARVPLPGRLYQLRVGRTSLRPQLEEVPTEDLEALAREVVAEAARRALVKKEADASKAREYTACWMRVHGKAAHAKLDNFLTGVTQAMACRAVLRWAKGHKPAGGTNPASGEDWTDEEIYETEQTCYARGHVPPWHLDGAKAIQRLKQKTVRTLAKSMYGF